MAHRCRPADDVTFPAADTRPTCRNVRGLGFGRIAVALPCDCAWPGHVVLRDLALVTPLLHGAGITLPHFG